VPEADRESTLGTRLDAAVPSAVFALLSSLEPESVVYALDSLS
jgi:hypothetical protein